MSEGVVDTALLARPAAWLEAVEEAVSLFVVLGLVAHVGAGRAPATAYGAAAAAGVVVGLGVRVWRRWRPREMEPAPTGGGAGEGAPVSEVWRWWERVLIAPALAAGLAVMALIRSGTWLVCVALGTWFVSDDHAIVRTLVAIVLAVLALGLVQLLLLTLRERWGLDAVTIRAPRWRRARADAHDLEPA